MSKPIFIGILDHLAYNQSQGMPDKQEFSGEQKCYARQTQDHSHTKENLFQRLYKVDHRIYRIQNI